MSTPISSVPYSCINRFEPGFLERWSEKVAALSKNTQFIGGEVVKNLEKRLGEKTGVEAVSCCANGTDALQLALRALGVGPGDIVLIPDLTFWATFEAVCNVGARPVTVDVTQEDFHLGVRDLVEALERFRPKAVILVHLYGWAARATFELREICKRKEVYLIEDSAQAWGVEIDSESVFKNAFVSTTSFYPGKVLGAAGDGGAVFTNSLSLASKVQSLANHGRAAKYEHDRVGWNSRLDTLQAAFVDLNLDFIDGRITSRRLAAQWYRENLKVSGLEMRGPSPEIKENGYISVATCRAELREKIIGVLDRAQVGHGVVYPMATRLQPGAAEFLAGSLNKGVTDDVCKNVLNLPCFAGVTLGELGYVKEVLEGASW